MSLIKSRFEFWDEWTGSRYVRVTNPHLNELNLSRKNFCNNNKKPHIRENSVCRSDPVSGEWISDQDKHHRVWIK